MTASRLLSSIYEFLARIYPPTYRREFGEERTQVFSLGVEESQRAGWVALVIFCLRELRDLPGSLLHEHLHERRLSMRGTAQLEGLPATQRQALLAGLPYFLYALSTYLPVFLGPGFYEAFNRPLTRYYQLLHNFPPTWWALTRLAPADYWTPSRVFYQSVGWLFSLVVLAVLLASWLRGWPRWSGGWVGTGLVLLLDLLIILFPQDAESLISILVWMVGYMLALFWLARSDPFAGLLAMLPVYPMFFWYLTLDGVKGTYPEAYTFLAAGLCLSLAVYAAVRKGSFKLGLGLILLTMLGIGSVIAYQAIYNSNSPLPPPPTPNAVVSSTLGGFIGLAIFGLPLWALLLYRRARRPRKSTV